MNAQHNTSHGELATPVTLYTEPAERAAWQAAGLQTAELGRTATTIAVDATQLDAIRAQLLAASSPRSGHTLTVQIGADSLVEQIDNHPRA